MKKLILALSVVISSSAFAATCGPNINPDSYCKVAGENQIQAQRIELDRTMNPDDDVVVTQFNYQSEPLTHRKMMEPNENH